MCTWQPADRFRRGGDEAESVPPVNLSTAHADVAQLSGAGISSIVPLFFFAFLLFRFFAFSLLLFGTHGEVHL